MIFRETALPGVMIVQQERREDHRGYFARTFCADEFIDHGLDPRCVQASVSFNRRRGTLRGLHYQVPPYAEVKLVRCLRGAIWDVALDLRPDSPTFRSHIGVELTAESGDAIYIPPGLAHGFQTLEDNTEVFYQMSERYAPAAQHGVRFDDPAFGIQWPLPSPILLERDRSYADFPVGWGAGAVR
jgi:dTDP-4-dehydrorhamnose 3,5-epimerase